MLRLYVVLFIGMTAFDVKGMRIYENCLVFSPGETKPEISNGEWYCLYSNDNEFCVFVECPQLECEKPEASGSGKCSYCQGTCSYGGSVRNLRESFTCLDKSNRCMCSNNNMIFSTRISSDPRIMCSKE